MYTYTPGHSRLISLGAHLPTERLTTQAILQSIDAKHRFGIPYDWIERVMGIKERRVESAEINPSDMATKAAENALRRANTHVDEIDAIIYAGIVRDYLEPATAHIVQHKLGTKSAIAFDISNACHGFMNAMHLMDCLIATGQVRRGLILTGEKTFGITQNAMTALLDTNCREDFMRLLPSLTLGDAGAAMLMGPKLDPDTGFMGFIVQSQSQFHHLGHVDNNLKDALLLVDMATSCREGVRLCNSLFEVFIDKLKWNPRDISKCVFHQPGKRILQQINFPQVARESFRDSLQDFGNVASANVPLNLYLLEKEISQGEKVFVTGAGSGIAVSQAGIIWDAA